MSRSIRGFRDKARFLVQNHISLIVILLIFLALGGLYNVSLPLFEAPDEWDHFLYVHWLAAGHGLPNVTTDLQDAGHEIGQPPLYYAALAPVLVAPDTQDLHQVAPPNPYWIEGAGANVHYHTSAEWFPYRDTALAVHLARFATTLVACVTIVSTYGLARIAAPRQAALAATLVAFNPQFVFLASVINNDTLITALCGLTLLVLLRLLVPRRVPWWQYVLLGVLCGLAMLTKLTGLALGGIILLGLLLASWRHRTWRSLVVGGIGVSVGVAITAGWWFVRNGILYGDPLALEVLLSANRGLVRPELMSWSDTLHYATYLHRSFWAMFGYGLPAPDFFYQFVNALALLGLIGAALWLVLKGRKEPTQPATVAVLLLMAWSLVVFVLLLRWMRQVDASNQGRLLFPAISSLAVLVALGLSVFRISKRGPGRGNWLGLILVTFLLVWAVATPFLIIRPAYEQPKPLPATAEVPNPTPVQFDEVIRLLGYGLPQSSVQGGTSLPVELYWQALAPMSESYVVALHALDPAGQVVAGLDTIPYQARYPTPSWQPGTAFRDSYRLPIEPGATPGQAKLLLAVYPWGRPDEALSAMVGDTQVDGNMILTTFKIAPTEKAEYSPASATNVVFDQQVRLLGFQVPETVEAGRPFTLTLYWEALAPDGSDYTVFVHLLDDDGTLVAQGDGPPQSGWYPTSIWAAGEQIRDPKEVWIPGDVGPGRYGLAVGFYDPATGRRLPAYDEDGERWPNDSVHLGSVGIAGGP